jgi:hypothetical protein
MVNAVCHSTSLARISRVIDLVVDGASKKPSTKS